MGMSEKIDQETKKAKSPQIWAAFIFKPRYLVLITAFLAKLWSGQPALAPLPGNATKAKSKDLLR